MGAPSCSRCLIYLCVFLLVHILVYFLHFRGVPGIQRGMCGMGGFKGVNPQQAQAKGKIFKLCTFFNGEKNRVFSSTAVIFVLRFKKRHAADFLDLIGRYVSCRTI